MDENPERPEHFDDFMDEFKRAWTRSQFPSLLPPPSKELTGRDKADLLVLAYVLEQRLAGEPDALSLRHDDAPTVGRD